MGDLDDARAALAECDAPPEPPETRHYLECAEGHPLATASGPVPPWSEEEKQKECTICPCPYDDAEWQRQMEGRRVITRVWAVKPPTVVDAKHLRAALAEVDRLTAERDRLDQTLRCERGEWAPDEWTAVEFDVGGLGASRVQWQRQWRGPWARATATVWRVAGAWRWQTAAYNASGSGEAPTALEAIEACNAAIRAAVTG